MLVCSVSLRAPRRIIETEIVEFVEAIDLPESGLIFATLIDDPVAAVDTLDAFFGQIMIEAATAADNFDAGFGLFYSGGIVETMTGASTVDGSIAPAGTIGTWNPSDKSANTTLTNSNLTAAGNNTNHGGVRSTTKLTSGKAYFELSLTGVLSLNACGVATGAADYTNFYNNNGVGGAIVIPGNGYLYVNGSTIANIVAGGGGITSPAVICFAIDLTNSRMWARVGSGNWNGSGTANPSTNTGGADISGLFPTNNCYAAVDTWNNTGTFTVNFGGSSFAQSIPSGFSAWNSIAT
jgi:hypothetical protein